MHIGINGISLRVGGGLTLGKNLLIALDRNEQISRIDAYLPAGVGYENLPLIKTYLHTFPAALLKWQIRPLQDHFIVPLLLRQQSVQAVISLGNYAIPQNVPQLVLFHSPHRIYPQLVKHIYRSWRHRVDQFLRSSYFRYTLKYADGLVVQTPIVSQRLRRIFQYQGPIHIIPNSYSQLNSEASIKNADKYFRSIKRHEKDIHLLCLTRYYPHKNLEILLEVAEEIRRRNLPFKLITTIEKQQHPRAKLFLESCHRRELNQYIYNIGEVQVEDVGAVVKSCDAVILPSLLESFSGVYVEAMQHKRPIFTSNLDFAYAACGSSAFYFDPTDPIDIVDKLIQAFGAPEILTQHIEKGSERIVAMPDWDAIACRWMDILVDL